MAVQELSFTNTELTCRQTACGILAVPHTDRAFGAQLPLP